MYVYCNRYVLQYQHNDGVLYILHSAVFGANLLMQSDETIYRTACLWFQKHDSERQAFLPLGQLCFLHTQTKSTKHPKITCTVFKEWQPPCKSAGVVPGEHIPDIPEAFLACLLYHSAQNVRLVRDRLNTRRVGGRRTVHSL